MNRIKDVVKLVVNVRIYPVYVHEIENSFRTMQGEEVESDEDVSESESESVSKENAGKEKTQHDVHDQVFEIGIEKTPINTAGVIAETSTMDTLIVNKLMRESEVPTWSWDEIVAIVDRTLDGINMGMNIEEMKQQPSMDIEQVERHACSDRNASNALLNKATYTQVIEYNGTLRKVRSVSNVVFSFMHSEERIEVGKKLKKKG
ncbi:hypothetical protein V6N12_013231 [Hibiscus sabdariffa]|uniref:Uncharacterized protein n=1 Tax=Hibiscus sabdariffa TaxID=183260 RepID=A0ABR2D5X2_9ROSI